MTAGTNDGEQAVGWQDYTELKNILKALGDTVRLNIVHLLARDGEVTVTDLVQRLLISQPLVSWHLTMLRRAGLVRTRRKGRLVYCSLDHSRCALSLEQLGQTLACPAESIAPAAQGAREVPIISEPAVERSPSVPSSERVLLRGALPAPPAPDARRSAHPGDSRAASQLPNPIEGH